MFTFSSLQKHSKLREQLAMGSKLTFIYADSLSWKEKSVKSRGIIFNQTIM